MHNRRRFLATSAGMILLSGCSGGGGSDDDGSDDGGSDESGGVSTDGSDTDSADGQCDPSVIEDESTNTLRWEGFANGTFEIESVDLTLTNLVNFPIDVLATVFFYHDEDDFEPAVIESVSAVLEGGESREFEITRTGLETTAWDVEIDVSCP